MYGPESTFSPHAAALLRSHTLATFGTFWEPKHWITTQKQTLVFLAYVSDHKVQVIEP